MTIPKTETLRQLAGSIFVALTKKKSNEGDELQGTLHNARIVTQNHKSARN